MVIIAFVFMLLICIHVFSLVLVNIGNEIPVLGNSNYYVFSK